MWEGNVFSGVCLLRARCLPRNVLQHYQQWHGAAGTPQSRSRPEGYPLVLTHVLDWVRCPPTQDQGVTPLRQDKGIVAMPQAIHPLRWRRRTVFFLCNLIDDCVTAICSNRHFVSRSCHYLSLKLPYNMFSWWEVNFKYHWIWKALHCMSQCCVL